MSWCLKGTVQTISPAHHWSDAEAVHDGKNALVGGECEA